MLVALGGGDAFRHLNVEHLFAFAILFSYYFGQSTVSQLAVPKDTLPTDVRQVGY